MGLDVPSAEFFRHARMQGVEFSRTLILGHQHYYMSEREFSGHLAALGSGKRVEGNRFADPFFHALGAAELDIMDASDYEGANLIHDLNNPVPESLHGRYDCVIDGGTLEHVFNLPVAIKNCLLMVRPGGHFLSATPCDGMAGHGFYQFSPELYFRVCSAANGFEVQEMLIERKGAWYSVPDPDLLQCRVELKATAPLLLYLRARRTAEVPVFLHWPQQSDYNRAWKVAESSSAGNQLPNARRRFRSFAERNLGVPSKLLRAWDRLKTDRIRAAHLNRILKPIHLCS